MPLFDALLALVAFDKYTGFFHWKDKGRGGRPVGAFAGSLIYPHGKSGRAYYTIRHFGKHVLAHRLAWYLHHGVIPKGTQIDHINHNGLDNRIENLRLVTGRTNAKNLPMRRDNTSGQVGVYRHCQIDRWVAEIFCDGKKHSLGCFKRKHDAVLARKAAERRLGFHRNHGRKKAG